jgi:hypothetical protein
MAFTRITGLGHAITPTPLIQAAPLPTISNSKITAGQTRHVQAPEFVLRKILVPPIRTSNAYRAMFTGLILAAVTKELPSTAPETKPAKGTPASIKTSAPTTLPSAVLEILCTGMILVESSKTWRSTARLIKSARIIPA